MTVKTASQTDILVGVLESLLAEVKATGVEPKVFSSGNTGVYVQKRLKAPEARLLGLTIPQGGKLSLTIQALVIDPANSKDA